MYWKLRMQPPSAINGLLGTEDCTLQCILDEDTVLDELKTSRTLLEFLCRDVHLQQLVALVVEEPPSDLPEGSRYKRSQTAADMFATETSALSGLVDKLATDDDLLDKLWQFLAQEAPLNSLLASFFLRTVLSVLQRQAAVLLAYVRRKGNILDRIVQHIGTSAVMDLLLSFLTNCNTAHLRQDLLDWFQENNLVEHLVDQIQEECSDDKQRNAARALSEMIRICYEQASRSSDSAGGDPLLEVLESERVLRLLLSHMTGSGTAHRCVLHCADVIQAMLSAQHGRSDLTAAETPAAVNTAIARRVITELANWLPALHKILLNPSPCQPIVTSIETISVPLGAARLALIQLLIASLQAKVGVFVQEFVRQNIGSTLLDLFLEFKWNSFLHLQFVRFATFSLSSGQVKVDDDGEPVSLAESMFVENHLLKQLASAGLENEAEQGKAGRPRRGYMGHLVQLSNSVVTLLKDDGHVSGLAKCLDESDLCVWTEWVDGPLANANQKNNSVLGGTAPVSLEDEEGEQGQLTPFELESPALEDIQQAFLTYQLNSLASEFADSFGFCDEQMCVSDPPLTAPLDEITSFDFDLATPVPIPVPDHFQLCYDARVTPFNEQCMDSQTESFAN